VKRSRVFLLPALPVATVLVTSGCFQIRMFKLNKDSIAAGEMVTVRVETFPVSMRATDTNPGCFFLLIGYDDIAWQGPPRSTPTATGAAPTTRATTSP
jgi:hypothetical protein